MKTIKEYQKWINENIFYIHKVNKINLFKNLNCQYDNLTDILKFVIELIDYVNWYNDTYGLSHNEIYNEKIYKNLNEIKKELKQELKYLKG